MKKVFSKMVDVKKYIGMKKIFCWVGRRKVNILIELNLCNFLVII